MKLKNTSNTPITCPRLGVDLPLPPGHEIELDDRLCLRTRTIGFGNSPNLSRPSIVERLVPQLIPAHEEDHERYQSVRVEDLSDVIAERERNIAEQNGDDADAGTHLGQGRFTRR